MPFIWDYDINKLKKTKSYTQKEIDLIEEKAGKPTRNYGRSKIQNRMSISMSNVMIDKYFSDKYNKIICKILLI